MLALAAGCSTNSRAAGLGATASPSVAHGTSAATPSAASSAPTGQGGASTVSAWYNGGGEDLLLSLIDDYTYFNNLSAFAEESAVCLQIQDDVRSVQAYGPVPDQRDQAELSTALMGYSTAATDCVAAATNNSTAAMGQASTELDKAYGDLTSAMNDMSAGDRNSSPPPVGG